VLALELWDPLDGVEDELEDELVELWLSEPPQAVNTTQPSRSKRAPTSQRFIHKTSFLFYECQWICNSRCLLPATRRAFRLKMFQSVSQSGVLVRSS
jgi:hypothetical protein